MDVRTAGWLLEEAVALAGEAGEPAAARALDAQAAGPASNGAERVRMALGALRPWGQEPCVREVIERAALRTPT